MIKKCSVLLIIGIIWLIIPVNAFVYDYVNGGIVWGEINPYVMQGETICVNQTVDISGVLQGNDFVVWYDKEKYGEEYSYYPYKIKLPEGRKGWYNFYLDPDIFEPRTGVWYKFWSEKPNRIREGHENMIAFIVNECPKNNEGVSL